MNIVWSFSSLKTFQQCPKKYYHTKVAKDIKEPDTQATLYGKSVHTAAEEFIRDGKPIPPEYEYLRGVLENLRSIEGDKYCELRLGLTEDLQACEFDAPNVWWHGIADLVIINEEKKLAYSLDYKTSKSARYADVKQLDLVAAGIFARFPNIVRVKSALAFVVSKEFVKAEHMSEKMKDYVAKPAEDVARIKAAYKTGVWNPVQGPLCKFCAVKQCDYNRS